MDIDNLVTMANRIGAFFEAMPDREAALAGVAEHVRKFWDPRMRRQLLAALDTTEAARLDAFVREALAVHRASLEPQSA
jgi:formate dehydrogenase subunit delta